MGKVSRIVGSTFSGIKSVIGGVSFVALGREALELGDSLSKASEKLGISVEKLSAMSYAAQLSDVSLEGLEKGMKKFSQAIVEANSATSDAATAFSILGIKTTDVHGKTLPLDILFAKVADRFMMMNDGAGKVSIAVALFGRAGMDMIPILNKGAAGIRELEGEAKRLGATISDETAKKLADANDNLKSFWMAVKGTAASITGELVGALKKMGDAFGKSLGTTDEGFVFGPDAKKFKAPPPPKKTEPPNIEKLKKDDEFRAKQAKESQAELLRLTKDFGEGLQDVNEQIRIDTDKETELWSGAYKVRAGEIIDLMKDFGDDSANGFEVALTSAQAFENAFMTGNVQAAIQQINDGLGATWASLADSQSAISLYRQAWLDANQGIWESMTNLYSGMQNWISSSLQGLIEGVMTVSDVMKNLGKMMLSVITEYVAKWLVSRLFMAVMGKAFQAQEIAAAIFTGAAVAEAWAPAAAFVSLATLGANSFEAMAGLATTVGFAQSLAVPALAEGGIVSRPTLALIGEKGPEAVVPLSGGGAGHSIILQLDGEVLARWFHKAGRAGTLRLVPA